MACEDRIVLPFLQLGRVPPLLALLAPDPSAAPAWRRLGQGSAAPSCAGAVGLGSSAGAWLDHMWTSQGPVLGAACGEGGG